MLKHTCIAFCLLLLSFGPLLADDTDPYSQYIKSSKDFRRVKQDKEMLLRAFPSWTYMPWTYQWTIGYNDSSGKWCAQHGYNGAFIDRDEIAAEGSNTGRLDWINQSHLHFYVDHLANKHDLHLWDSGEMKKHYAELHSTGIRPRPLNADMTRALHEHISRNIAAVKSSPYRSAYALDDEISWGHFVHPTMWQITDDASAYQKWLAEIYGGKAPARQKWVSYNDILPKLASWNLAQFDASPLMDQWTFNDSYWCNYLGELVEYANQLDPATPVGIVGGQSPSPFGGYDYAKLSRKIQFIEAYDLGSSQAILRSFNPHNAIPMVTTHFHRNVDDDVHQVWNYLAHGNRGMIGWVQGWFNGKEPLPWHDQTAATFLEAAEHIGPMTSGTEWVHDGVAIYYSQASIQLGWILDAAAHGKTWINRNGDNRLGASHLVRQAWQNMLRDEGIQYNFLSYADVVEHGVPTEYRVLILPACLCLSDAEARQIKAFVAAGGTVIADYLPGAWDQHGKGRAVGGALDDLFGIHHDPAMNSKSLFNGGALWCEVDTDANFSWKSYEQFLTNQNSCVKDASGFHKAVRDGAVNHTNHSGHGVAVLLNLSPQWYNAYRVAGAEAAGRRSVFMNPIHAAGIKRRATIEGDNTFGAEITYWQMGNRTTCFVVHNSENVGEPGAVALKNQTARITLRFERNLNDARDERTGKLLPDGREFSFDWKMNEAVVVSGVFDAR